jgi:hypothetical protein
MGRGSTALELNRIAGILAMAGSAFYSSAVNAQVASAVATGGASLGLGEDISALGRTAGTIANQNNQVNDHIAAVNDEIALREQNRARQATAINFGVSAAQTQAGWESFKADHHNDADFEQKYNDKVTSDTQALRGMLGNDTHLLDQFDEHLAAIQSSAIASGHVYAVGLRAKNQAADWENTQGTLINLSMSHPENVLNNIALGNSVLGQLNIPDGSRAAAQHSFAATQHAAALKGWIAQGRAAQVAQEVGSGAYDHVIEPDDRKIILSQAKIAIDSATTAAAAVVAGQQKDLNAQLSAAEITAEGGADPGQAQIDAIQKAAVALKDPVALAKITNLNTQAHVNRIGGALPETQRLAIVQQLNDLNTAGKATPEQQRQLKDWQSFNTNKLKADVAPLKQLYDQGSQGIMQVVQQLDALPVADRVRRAEAIDHGFSAIALLPPATRGTAIMGKDLLPDIKGQFAHKVNQQIFYSGLGLATSQVNFTDQEAVADAIYAYHAHKNGVTTFDPKLYQEARNEALGGQKINGVWHGGAGLYNGNAVILPPHMTAADFSHTLDYKQSFDGALIADSHGGLQSARLVNGGYISKTEALTHYIPTYMGHDPDSGATVYGWRSKEGGYLKKHDGTDFHSFVSP